MYNINIQYAVIGTLLNLDSSNLFINNREEIKKEFLTHSSPERHFSSISLKKLIMRIRKAIENNESLELLKYKFDSFLKNDSDYLNCLTQNPLVNSLEYFKDIKNADLLNFEKKEVEVYQIPNILLKISPMDLNKIIYRITATIYQLYLRRDAELEKYLINTDITKYFPFHLKVCIKIVDRFREEIKKGYPLFILEAKLNAWVRDKQVSWQGEMLEITTVEPLTNSCLYQFVDYLKSEQIKRELFQLEANLT